MPHATQPTTRTLRAALGCITLAAAAPAAWGGTPFSAVVDGQSQIVEVINPTGPVVRVATQATGSFEGNGQFISASLANTHFSFLGEVSAVPEPGAGLLWALGLLGLGVGVATGRAGRRA